MDTPSALELLGFGPNGWGLVLLNATLVTVAVAAAGVAIGAVIGGGLAFAKVSGGVVSRTFADAYTTVVRGVPDLLVIYLFYFGGSSLLSSIGTYFGSEGFIGVPAFATGAIALAVVSGAYQTEVYRGAYNAIAKGELEAARAAGMLPFVMFRRVIAPQVLRFALPGLGNIWQLVLKDSALISVIGLVELLRASAIGAGSTRQPFVFYMGAAALYLAVSTVSSSLFRLSEKRALRGLRRT